MAGELTENDIPGNMPQGVTFDDTGPSGITFDDDKKSNPLKTAGSQFIAGLNDVTEFIVRPAERTLGTVTIGPNGVELLGPDEVKQRRASGDIGLPGMALEKPTDILGKGSRMAGQSAAIGPILGRIFGLVPATEAGAFMGGAKNFVSNMGQSFARAPVSTTAMDTASGFGAGAVGGIAEKIFPGSDAAEFVGQMLGGVATPLLIPANLALKAANGVRSLFNKLRAPFTEQGGKSRAEARFDRAVPDGQKDAALEELDRTTTLDPATGEPVLTPAQRTGEPGLLSLEKSVMDSTEELARHGNEQIANANRVIQESMSALGPGQQEATFRPIVEAHAYLDNLLDTRIRAAAQHTDERIAQLGTGATRENSNLIAREELDKALDAAVQQQRDLYALIPEKTAAPFTATKAAFEKLRSELGSAQMVDIPTTAKKFLSDKSADYFGNHRPVGFKDGETTIKELRSLQSKLRADARNARSGDKKNLNKARIADAIANAIDDDLTNAAAGTDVSEAVSAAVNFSRNMHDRFSRGIAGKLLGYTSTGADRVLPGMTLEQSIGMAGPKAREGLDSLMKVFDAPEAPGSDTMVTAVQDYVKTRFLKKAVEQGELNVNAANRFIQDNAEILKRLPGLKSQLDEVIQSGQALALTQRQRDRILLDDPRVSKATFLIEKGSVEAFRQISKLNAADAAKETQMLVNRVSHDESGEALAGLKSGFIELMMNAAKRDTRDAQGLSFVSGYGLRDALATPGNRAAANRLFSEEELNRLGTITRDLIRLEKRTGTATPKEGVIGDQPGWAIEYLAKMVGAAYGRHQSKMLGMGGNLQAPAMMAKRFNELISAGVRDPAARLLRDAIYDETLFKQLLQSKTEKGGAELSKVATKRLNAWTAAVLAEHGGAFEE